MYSTEKMVQHCTNIIMCYSCFALQHPLCILLWLTGRPTIMIQSCFCVAIWEAGGTTLWWWWCRGRQFLSVPFRWHSAQKTTRAAANGQPLTFAQIVSLLMKDGLNQFLSAKHSGNPEEEHGVTQSLSAPWRNPLLLYQQRHAMSSAPSKRADLLLRDTSAELNHASPF